jgi:hypothetical protein
VTGCPSRSSCPPVARGRPGAELADSLSMAFLVLLEALSPVERAVLGRRRQGAGDREAAGPAVARHAAARRPAPPGPGPRRLDPAGLGRRPAERRVVRRQRARGQRGRARRGRRRGQAIRAVVNPGKLGHIGPVSDVARLPPAQNAQFRAPKYGHPANGDPVQNGGNARFVQAEGQSRSVSRGLGGARVACGRACTGARRWRWSDGGRRELRTILGRSSRIWRSRWRWAGNYADRAATAARLSILSLCDTISQPPEPEATRSVLPAVHQWLPRTGRRTSRRVCASSCGSATAGKCPPRSCSCHVVRVK